MIRFLEYTGFALLLLLLQILLFNRLQINGFFNIYIYILFIIALPANVNGTVLLLSAGAIGACVDFTCGTPGIHAMAALFIAFLRPVLIRIFIGSDEESQNCIPSSLSVGPRKYLGYAVTSVLVYDITVFMLEALSWENIGYTLLRILASSAASVFFIYLLQLMLPLNRKIN